MQLTIASSNPNKIIRLRKLISNIRKDIFIDDISNLSIPLPEESSKTQLGNLLIKLKYYYNILHKNIISEDDCFEFKIKNKSINVINVNRFFPNEKNQFLAWKNFFTDYHIFKGRLIKYFGVIINSRLKKRKVIIPIKVYTSELKQNKEEINILNNFIGPYSSKKVFVKMSAKEKDLFILKACSSQLRKMLI